MSPSATLPVGTEMREWRQRRHLSQLDLPVDAEVPTRHLSFVETGRAMPSREMVLRLADRRAVPLREHDRLLTSAGFAPMHAERPVDDPALDAAPPLASRTWKPTSRFPHLRSTGHWNLVFHNAAADALLQKGIAPQLLQAPVNVLRVSPHPKGLAPRIVNFAQWCAHLFEWLHHQIGLTADTTLAALADELAGHPAPALGDAAAFTFKPNTSIVVPLVLETPLGQLSFISTMTVFGTPVGITCSELALQTFFPADAATARALRLAAEVREAS